MRVAEREQQPAADAAPGERRHPAVRSASTRHAQVVGRERRRTAGDRPPSRRAVSRIVDGRGDLAHGPPRATRHRAGRPRRVRPSCPPPRSSTRCPTGIATTAATAPSRDQDATTARAHAALAAIQPHRPRSRASSTLKTPRSRIVQPRPSPLYADRVPGPAPEAQSTAGWRNHLPRAPPPYDKAVASPLPAVDALVREAACDAPHELCVREARATLAERRARGEQATAADLAPELRRRVRAALESSLRPVLNATGVVLHTNLGRAPLAEAALAHVQAVAAGYSILELDLATGARGSRQDHVAALICELTGAEAALCVNNGAAALVLALAAQARGREIVISRGQLVEIGDGFRIPEIVESAGALLREVGTTNRTRPADYTTAFGPQTGAGLCVHPSNYRVLGFTGQVEARALAELAHARVAPGDLRRGLRRPDRRARARRRTAGARRTGATAAISCASRATSCSAGPRPESSPAARPPSPPAGATPSHALSASTSSRWPRSRPRCASTAIRRVRAPELPVLRAVLEPAAGRPARARSALAARIGGTVVATVAQRRRRLASALASCLRSAFASTADAALLAPTAARRRPRRAGTRRPTARWCSTAARFATPMRPRIAAPA